MKALVLDSPGKFTIREQDEPQQLASHEVLVRVHRVGVCGTDIHAYRGRQPFFSYPRILGHELGVEIVTPGSAVKNKNLKEGDRCAVEPYLNCGDCHACRRGRTNCCQDLQVLGVHIDGGMRDYMVVPANKLYPANELSFEQLALIETLSIGAHAVERSNLSSSDRVLVIGAGPIGLSAIQWALHKGADISVLDIDPRRLALCRDQLHVSHTFHAQEKSPGELLSHMHDSTGNALYDVVFDATGNQASMQQSFSFCAQGGRLVFIGLFPGEVSFHDPEFHRRELTLLASRNSTRHEFEAIITAVRSKALNTAPWITHSASLLELPGVFDTWLQPSSNLLKGTVQLTAP
jgi:2-desacetyl-2-hydroxyethyl bacteriochlorophyllide A dehydrogenase